jgi:hypothetical protein
MTIRHEPAYGLSDLHSMSAGCKMTKYICLLIHPDVEVFLLPLTLFLFGL